MSSASFHTASLSASSALLQQEKKISKFQIRTLRSIAAFKSRRSYGQIRSSFTDFSASPNTGGRTELDALSRFSEVVLDTVVFDDFERL